MLRQIPWRGSRSRGRRPTTASPRSSLVAYEAEHLEDVRPFERPLTWGETDQLGATFA